MKLRKIMILFFFLLGANLKAQVNQPCQEGLQGPIGMVGDSRAVQLIDYPGLNNSYIQDAKFNGQLFFPTGLFPVVQNRAEGGRTAATYREKILNCGVSGQNFWFPPRAIVSLGGNDLIGFYGKRKDLKEQWDAIIGYTNFSNAVNIFFKKSYSDIRKTKLRDAVSNPFKVIADQIQNFLDLAQAGKYVLVDRGAGALSFQNFWDWHVDTKTTSIENDLDFVLRHGLDQSGGNRIMMNTIAPLDRFNLVGADFLIFNKMVSSLNHKIRKRMYPALAGVYGDRIILLDGYPVFMGSLLMNPSPSNLYIDGVHFKPEGLQLWAKIIAVFMVLGNWFNSTIDRSLLENFASELEALLAKVTVDFKAIEEGIPNQRIISAKLNFQESGGFDKDFAATDDKRIYLKDGDDQAFTVRGLILDRYLSEGGPQGRFGFPRTDEWAENFGTIKNSDFECGRIFFNHVNGQTTSNYFPDDDAYRDSCNEKKKRDQSP